MPRTTPPKKIKKSKNQNEENNFVPMPFWLLERKDLTHFQKLLLGVISNLCKNSEEGCYARTKMLSLMTGSSEQYIKNQLNVLEEKGWIHRENLGDRRFIYPSLERKRKESIENEGYPIKDRYPIRDPRVPPRVPKGTSEGTSKTDTEVLSKVPNSTSESTMHDDLPIILKEKEKKLEKKYIKKSFENSSKINTKKISNTPKPKLKKKSKPVPKRKIKQDPYFIDTLKKVLSSSNGRFIDHKDFETKFIPRWKYWVDYSIETHNKKFNNMVVDQLSKIIADYSIEEFMESTSLSMSNGWKKIVWPDEVFNKNKNYNKPKKNSSDYWDVDHSIYDKGR